MQKTILCYAILLIAGTSICASAAEQGDDNPTGVAGAFNGNITTGCSYDPYTGNAHRQVDDIVVPGGVGAYPLKWTRYFNSHATYNQSNVDGSGTGGQWRFSYIDYRGVRDGLATPDGRIIEGKGDGVEEFVDINGLHLADGGVVTVSGGNGQIIDPYGQKTNVTTTGSGVNKITIVTEPAGRYIFVNYNQDGTISQVAGYDGVNPQPVQTVNYYWVNFTLAGIPNSVPVLDHVVYSDGTQAHYTYTDQSYLAPPTCSIFPRGRWHAALLLTADDVRYAGPMRQIAYKYYASGNKTRVLSENRLVNGTAGEVVSSIAGVASSAPTVGALETRGDGPQRRFSYDTSPVVGECTGEEPKPLTRGSQGKLLSYTDFYFTGGTPHTTTIGYEGTDPDTDPHFGFINQVTDANNHTTMYERQTNSWGITKITHPDLSTIQQTFAPAYGYDEQSAPWFLASRTDENGHTTVYHRDDAANPNAITKKDYPDGTFETFAYNNRAQILTHRMRNGAYVHFSYDTRGLLLAKTNPTWTADHDTALASEAKATYTYYTAADYGGVWTDRVRTETDPRGIPTTYEYDRTLDYSDANFPNGQSIGAPCAGRGLVTKVTHADNTYQSFAFDKYGDKVWEENELRKRTTYTRDAYGRVVKVTNPLGKFATSDYTPSNNTSLSPYTHTTNCAYQTITPTGIKTRNIYDANFRVTSTTVGADTGDAATTQFRYDPVGNQTQVIDPNTNPTTTDYDNRNRKWHVTDAQGHITTMGYDPASNNTTITRPDQSVEAKTYNETNKITSDQVPKDGTPGSPTSYVKTLFEYYPGDSSRMAGELFKVSQLLTHSDTGPRRTTAFEYDPSGLKLKMMYPSDDAGNFSTSQFQAWTYDSDHNLIARQTVNTVSQLFGWDNRNRQISMTWSNGLDWASFGYDNASRMTLAQNPTSIVTRAYDDANRLTLDRQQLQIIPIRAVSRKTHGSAGTFDVALPLTGKPGIECRPGQGANADQHQIIVMFPRAVSFTSAAVTSGSGAVSSTSQSADHTQVTINLTSVTNGQAIIVTIAGVNDGSVTNDVKIGMGVLLGDTTGNGNVNSSDIADVQGQSGQGVTTSNFRDDLTLNGSINSSDISTVQGQSGTGIAGGLPNITQPVPSSPAIDVQYSYDDDGKNTRLFATSTGASTAGYDLTFGYNDGQGRFRTITQAGVGQVASYTYDLASNETHRTTANGLDQVYGRDSLNRMSSRTINQGSTALSVEVYGYDPNRPGLMTSVTHQEGTTSATHDSFGYDLLPEMSSAQYNLQGAATQQASEILSSLPLTTSPLSGFVPPMPSPRNVNYGWDRAGNRTSLTDSMGPSYNYLTNSLNQYTTDGISNMTNGSEHELAAYQSINYTYVNDSHIWRIEGTDVLTGQQSRYEMNYDALGRRCVTVLNGLVTYYIYDGEKAILEYRGWSSGPSATNVYGKSIDEIIKRTDYTTDHTITPPLTIYYQDDHEGSITHITDTSGNVLEYYRYDVFGKPSIYNSGGNQIAASAFGNRFMFTGREYVANFGVYEYRNRAYHPGLGRFMSEDPKLFDSKDYNLFRYGGNDPLDKTDPMGTSYLMSGDTITMPISFHTYGDPYKPVSPQFINKFLSGINTILNGQRGLTFHAYAGSHAPGNDVFVIPGNKPLAWGDQTKYNYSIVPEQGGVIGGRTYSLEYIGAHVGMHFAGFKDQYTQSAPGAPLVPNPGHQHDIMGGVGTEIRAADAEKIRSRWHQGNTNFNPWYGGGNLGSVRYSQVQGLAGMTSIGNGYFTNRNGGIFTNGALQRAAGNFGAWNANHFGAFQSSPFNDDGNNNVNPLLRSAGL